MAMLRVFVSLSQTLNLSKTCNDLGFTRQTVRRHLTELETILGSSLFELSDRHYRLTPFGEEYLRGAKEIIVKLDTWSGQTALHSRVVDGLEHNSYTDPEGRSFFSQQHSVSKVSSKGSKLIQSAISAWGIAQARIEHEAWAPIRPYSILYRKTPAGWVFAEVGAETAYAKWFGWEWATSARGKLITDDNVGDDYNSFILGAYARIYDEGGLRLDHIYAHLPKDGGEPIPGSFQRLLLGGIFPDGTPGLNVVAVITKSIEIDAVTECHPNLVTDDLLMDDLG